MDYISLHNFTHFSILSSLIKPNDLFKHAAENNIKGVGVTDICSLGGIYDSYNAAKANKVKLIVGCQFNFVDDIEFFKKFNLGQVKDKPTEKPKNIVLIAKNQTGYKNILLLNRKGFDCRLGRTPLISWDDLSSYSNGVICLTGDSNGILGQSICKNDLEKTKKDIEKLKTIYNDDLAVEFVPNNLQYNDCNQFAVNRNLFKLVNELNLTPVAASVARYLKKDQHQVFDLICAIKSGRSLSDRSRPRFEYPQMYLHSAEEIVAFFKRNFGEEFGIKLCENSIMFADRCEKPDWVKPEVVTKDKTQLPEFPCQDHEDYKEFLVWKNTLDSSLKNLKEDKLFMRFLCEKNFDKLTPKGKEIEYRDRLNKEYEVFEALGDGKGFSSYMLITADFINWARKNGIPVGSGRGSVGGSIVGYYLGIHSADSIKYGLIFERFLNMEKKAYPDIDNDFDSEGRERVLGYVTNKYGKDYVAHVSNFITFTPKVAITDAITALEIGGDRASAFKIAKNITETIPADAKSFKDAVAGSKLFKEFVKDHPEIEQFAEPIIGVIRSLATHAAGVVVGKYELPGLVPIRLDDNNVVALEWEKERTEENGLVKIDFLGLETLNIIKNTNKIINDLKEPAPETPPNYDAPYPEVYNLITKGDTLGVFQFGASGGTIGLCNMTEPKTLDDLAIITALARPGVPAEIKKSFIERKFGREDSTIPHPNLERAVRATMGYCIFEESFLFLAHDFCGWDLQKSDKMRKISKLKAKGKHILEELRVDFIQSAMSHSEVTEEFATKIWEEWVIPLSGYAFNKSHSVLYSMTSLHTAYLKAYYRNEFLTANLISETNSNAPSAKDNVLKIRHDLRKSGVKIHPPKINQSYNNYRLIDKNNLVTGFVALHGVKEPAAEEIMNKRPFKSFEDFLLRTDSSKVRAPTIQALAAVGALDCFGLSRKTMYLYCSDLRKKYKAWMLKDTNKPFQYTLPKDEWDIGEIRALETHFLGEAFTGAREDSFPRLFSGHKAISSIADARNTEEEDLVVIEGEVIDLFTFKVKKENSKIYGQECCKMLLEDMSGEQISVVFFPDTLKRLQYSYEEHLPDRKFEKGFGIRASGKISKFGNDVSIIASDVYGIFEPIGMPKDLEQKTIKIAIVNNKEAKDITQDDVEDELLLIVNS